MSTVIERSYHARFRAWYRPVYRYNLNGSTESLNKEVAKEQANNPAISMRIISVCKQELNFLHILNPLQSTID